MLATIKPKIAATQGFSIPFAIICYICKNSKPSPSVLLKLYSSCKYFWYKIKSLPVSTIFISEQLLTVNNERSFSISKLPKVDFKFYIYGSLVFWNPPKNENQMLSTLLTLWRLELKSLRIQNQTLTLNEYKLLMQDMRFVDIVNTKIVRSDMSIVPLDVIYSIGSKIHKFHFTPNEDEILTIYSKEAIQKLFSTRNVKKLKDIMLFRVPETIDPIMYANFMKMNAFLKSQFFLFFHNIDPQWKIFFVNVLLTTLKQSEGWSCQYDEGNTVICYYNQKS